MEALLLGSCLSLSHSMKSPILRVNRIWNRSPFRTYSVSNSPRFNMVQVLESTIRSVDSKKREDQQKEETRKQKAQKHKKLMQKSPAKQKLTADLLNDKYRSEFKESINPGFIAEINGFFNSTEVRLEWTTAKFLDIPGEKERLDQEKQMENKTEEDLDAETDIVPAAKQSLSKSIGLPEIVFLGKANVGKSTLLNSLLTEASFNKAREFAFASKTAGFTQTMNCFNIGKRFRLIDTPGYGIRGTPHQGKQVMEYIHRRKELRRVYMLISAAEGFDENDHGLINFLTECGVPFEIVFTKVDRLKSAKIVDKILKESGILELASEPSLIFTNSETNKRFPKRQGLSELRSSIFEACALKPGIHPIKMIKK